MQYAEQTKAIRNTNPKRGIEQMKALTKTQAKTISELINSLTVWNTSVQRSDDNDQVLRAMKWHDEVADELATLGIDVVRFNHPANDPKNLRIQD